MGGSQFGSHELRANIVSVLSRASFTPYDLGKYNNRGRQIIRVYFKGNDRVKLEFFTRFKTDPPFAKVDRETVIRGN